MARIGWDLDGVSFEFHRGLEVFLTLEKGWDATRFSRPTHWEFYQDWGLSTEEFVKICDEGVDAGYIFWIGPALPGVVNSIDKLLAHGHEIHIITDRSFGSPGRSKKTTERWLAREGLKYTSLTFSADKTCLPLDYMIDDKLENYDALTAAGVEAYLLTRRWNLVDGDSRRRVRRVEEFAEAVILKENGKS